MSSNPVHGGVFWSRTGTTMWWIASMYWLRRGIKQMYHLPFSFGSSCNKMTNFWYLSCNSFNTFDETYGENKTFEVDLLQTRFTVIHCLSKLVLDGHWYFLQSFLSKFSKVFFSNVGQIYTLRPIKSKYCINIVQMYVISNILK